MEELRSFGLNRDESLPSTDQKYPLDKTKTGRNFQRKKKRMQKQLRIVAKNVELLFGIILEITRQLILALTPTFLRSKKNVRDRIVLITGSGSGFGRLMARRFADLGCKIVIWDINEKNARETSQLIKSKNNRAQIWVYQVDVSDRNRVYQVAKLVKTEVGNVDILINNAGVATADWFVDTPDDKLENLVQINSVSHFWTLKAFLPDMMERNSGHIVSVSSIAGFSGIPKATSYTASKHALIGMMEALSMELIHNGKTGVKTTVVCPYFSNTGFCDVVLSEAAPMVRPETVVDDIVEGVLLEREFVYSPRRVYAMRVLAPLLSNNFKCWMQILMCGADALNSPKAMTQPTNDTGVWKEKILD